MIALQLTIGGEYEDDGTTASSHLDSSLSSSLAEMAKHQFSGHRQG
jgi:hypothetical protein